MTRVDVAVIVEGIDQSRIAHQPWVHCRAELEERGIAVRLFMGKELGEAFRRPFDAMLLHVWQDWMQRTRFAPLRIMPILERLVAYRARFPETVQIAHNHADTGHPYAALTWRPGDPVLYRTPPYNRAELFPFPAGAVWAYEQVWGTPCFASDVASRHAAGFIGSPTGPRGYRRRVARATRKVGIGLCLGGAPLAWRQPLPKALHDRLMARCRIIVCPRGWGPQSVRHWDAWRSGKPVLTDRYCAAAEMIPGVHLEAGVHYLVFDEPDDIPDIVSDWTRPSRLDDLAEVAENGRRAALSYDPCARIIEFFERAGRRDVMSR